MITACIFGLLSIVKIIEIIAVVITAIATALLAFIANYQLNESNKTQNAQFLYQFKNDFFTEETRLVFQLIDAGWLEYVDNINYYDCYFKVRTELVDGSNLPMPIKEKLKKISVYSSYEIDDWLIGHFEDLGIFWRNSIIKKKY